MNKKITLSVATCLLTGLLMTGCSQQQMQDSGIQTASAATLGSPVMDGFGMPVKDGFGGIVRSASSSTQMQSTQAIDAQVQKTVPPTPMHAHKPQHSYPPMVKPKQVQKYRPMVKPVQTVKAHTHYSGHHKHHAPPRQCVAKVKIPAKFKSIVKRVQVSPAVNKRVKVRDAQYGYVSKQVQVRPATHHYQHVPAQYRSVTKKVLVKPAHYVWEKGKKGPITRIDHMTGEIMCRVKMPAVYKHVTHKVQVSPAQKIKRTTPAVYRTVKHKKLVSPAQYRNIHQPARFVNKTYQIQVSGERYKWQPIPGC